MATLAEESLSQSSAVESKDYTMEDLFQTFFVVPDFQREYVWQPSNVEKLLEDIYEEFYDVDGRLSQGSDYFIGSMVVCRIPDGRYQLIDGQQRMTTIYLVLCAIRDVLTSKGEGPLDALTNLIRSSSLDSLGNSIARYRMELQYEESSGVLDAIAASADGGLAENGATASVRNIRAAYRTVREYLSAKLGDEPERIRPFLAAFTKRVKLVRILTPNLPRALKVFETINDRGIGLDAVDLLKNLLFMQVPADKHQVLKERWKQLVDTLDTCREKPLRFLRYYIMSNHDPDASRGLREDEVYGWFVAHSAECGIKTEPLRFVDSLVACGRAYANFVGGKDVDGQANRFLQNIGYLSGVARQHLVILLAGRGLLPEAFSMLCREVENMLFCYIVSRQESKTLERNYTTWSRELRSLRTLDEVSAFLRARFHPELRRLVQDFDFAMQQLSMSRIQQYRMRYILAKLTQYVEESAWRKHTELQLFLAPTVDIEHILPRTPTPEVRAAFDDAEHYDERVQLLGNLVLLEKTINTSVSNGSFEAKSGGYRQSSFLLTRAIVEKPQIGTDTQLNRATDGLIQFDHWDSQTIELRQRMLVDLAKRVWLSQALATEAS